MRDRIQAATDMFMNAYNCSQSVCYAFSDLFPVDTDTVLKLSCGFGAGMARKQDVCGAVSGGIIVIGMRFGRGEKDGRPITEITYRNVQTLMDRFFETYGSYNCRRLLEGCDLSTSDGRTFFKENDLLRKICLPCVHCVVKILSDIL